MQVRQKVRDNIRGRLRDATPAEDRLYGRFSTGPYPQIGVSTPEDAGEQYSGSSFGIQNTMTLCLDIAVEQFEGDVSDGSDAMAMIVESVVDEDRSFGGVVDECVLISTVMEDIEDGESAIGFVRLVYELRYVK